MPEGTTRVDLSLSLQEAESVHNALEEILDKGLGNDTLERAYRVLGWRVLAVKSGTGLTARMAEIARDAENFEEYEAAREQALGPILEGLQRGENRDP